MKLKTRVFEFCNGKYSLPELAKALGITTSQIYRVKKGDRPVSEKFIIGAVKAFPGYKLDDLFYVAPSGKQNTQKPDEVMLTIGNVAQLLGLHPNTVRRWSKKGILKSYRIGRRADRRFRWQDICGFLKEEENE